MNLKKIRITGDCYLQFLATLTALFFIVETTAQRDVNTSINHLKQFTHELSVNERDLDEMKLSHVTSGGGGKFQVAYLQQTIQGIEIHNKIVNVVYNNNGEIVSFKGILANNLDRENIQQSPSIHPILGLRNAAAHLKLGDLGKIEEIEPGIGTEQKGILSKGLISQNDISYRLVYQDFGKQGILLCWEYVIYELSSQHWWQIRVDAQSGNYIDKNDWVSNCKVDHTLTMGRGHLHDVSCVEPTTTESSQPVANGYTVFAMPEESPLHSGNVRTDEVTPWLDGTGSPFGWHDTDGSIGAEFTITRGNNVYATEDQNADNNPGFAPDGGASLDFDFPIDFAQTPDTYQEAVITNLFYWNNIIHDVLYEYGFDEQSGNFQDNNYGNGGLGSDYVNADALDGSGTNNANFGTPPDGSNPRMQMFVWTATTPNRTSDLDNGVIVHEYGHGVSNRLTGGPNNTSCLFNGEQMGEGWSDYLGLMFTIKPGDTENTLRGIGNYVLGNTVNGTGIRQYPYTTDLAVNPHTYGDLPGVVAPHGVGSIWCAMLWEMTWALIDQYGFDSDIYNGTGGNNIALQLVMDGMKLQPCGPGFVDGRDAILLADQLNNGGANQCLIWEAFAKRGLGVLASQGSATSQSDGTEDFSTPCFCDPAPGVLGCTDPTACNYNSLAVCDDLSCIPSGCTDSTACNFDPEAGCDDGSCNFTPATPTLTLTTDCWGGEVSWEILDSSGEIIATNPIAYGNQTTYTWDGCMVQGECYTFNIFDSFGDGMNGTAFGCSTNGDYFMTDDDGTILFQMGDPNYGFGTSHSFCLGISEADCNDPTACNYNATATGSSECLYTDACGFCGGTNTSGCTDPTACNFDSTADCDDGSCENSGCLDPAACNYDSTAFCDNGNCTYGPSNDICSGAIPLSIGLNPISNAGACIDEGYFVPGGGCNTTTTWCNANGIENDVWYSFTTPASPNVITLETSFDGTGSLTDTQMAIFDACNGNLVAANDDGAADLYMSFLTFDCGYLNPNTTYFILIDGWNGDSGTANLTLTFDSAPCGGLGCTNATACNYDPTATVDDGSCEFTSCSGCTDSTACNFDSTATTDDGSCIYPLWYLPNTLGAGPIILSCTQPADYFLADQVCAQTVVDNDPFCVNTNWDGICETAYQCCLGNFGCTDTNACNFELNICSDNTLCTYPGCTDPGACNYDATAACDDGSCEFTSCTGCTDAQACNYDSTATIDDGSCLMLDECGICGGSGTAGCTDPGACNFDIAAACDDGSCEFTSCAGCTDAQACNYDSTATIDDGSCLMLDECGICGGSGTAGCTDPGACNFDIAAACDDGSCEFTSCAGCTDAQACNYDSTATIDDGSCLMLDECGICGGSGTAGCTDPGACNFDIAAACDNGSCEFTSCAGCTDAQACNYDSTATIDDGSCLMLDECGICGGSGTAGCTDPGACNFDIAAACDDGSCEFTSCAGCTDAQACNYDSTATIDDGSCLTLDECGVCGGSGTAGCTDPGACNFDIAAACDDGSCEFTSCAGCTDAQACNYDSTATIDDGSCLMLDECGICGGSGTAGCTDPGACNFDIAAACDDGSCEFTSCAGCTDAQACNYDSTATIDDGSCLMLDECGICGGSGTAGCTDPGACNFDIAAACHDGSCEFTSCAGCTDAQACNYDSTATIDDGSCLMLDECGICGGSGTAGCTDPGACNFDIAAACDDGSCEFTSCAGCTDAQACNYDSTATIDDGSCLMLDECGICGGSGTAGCTDPGACNFDIAAACDDGSCEFTSCAGCTDTTACNYDATATIDDGSCLTLDECGICGGSGTAGCTDPGACNFDIAAACDDGSCEFTSCAGCTDTTACNYDATATIDDGSCLTLDECGICGGNGTAGCTDPGACNFDATAACDDGSCDYTSCAGCTNVIACNYDSTATIDDGSCIIPDGCTDIAACNYDSLALCDDGTCTYAPCGTCMGDANVDGVVNILDLVSVSSNFGCLSGCYGNGDANFDEVVDILDLLSVSSNFGIICD